MTNKIDVEKTEPFSESDKIQEISNIIQIYQNKHWEYIKNFKKRLTTEDKDKVMKEFDLAQSSLERETLEKIKESIKRTEIIVKTEDVYDKQTNIEILKDLEKRGVITKEQLKKELKEQET